jgi:alginate O-acetyltransferase complex protein AlgI
MSFDSIFYLSCFLPLVLGLYWIVPSLKGKNLILLILGLLFYAFGSLTGIFLLLLSAGINYLFAILIKKTDGKAFLVIGVAANILFLFVYKYLDPILSAALSIPQFSLELTAPIGISFFTFKAISYLCDTQKSQESHPGTFLAFLLYLSFFPQILAGPITRYGDFSCQLAGRNADTQNIARGARRFIAGLAKKVLMCAAFGTVVDRIFAADPAILDIRSGWMAALFYMLQIFFDFAGYSDMSIGMSNMLGFQTPENFNYPYIAASIGDFWRRWHISLSTWFRDYLYIPLGGNRKGTSRTALNKIIVFALCGLWHGCGIPFLLWGLWHGLFSALESIGVIQPKKLHPALAHGYTLLVVCIGFVMFRANDVMQGLSVLGAMFTGFHFTTAGTVLIHQLWSLKTVFFLVLGCLLATPVAKKIYCPEFLTYAGATVLYLLCLAALASGGFTPFIYFQF